MAGTIVNNPVVQFFDNNGNPLAGGKITTYLSNTTTPASTWQNEGLSVLNTNPIILNSRGEATIWLTPDIQYTFVLTDANDNLIQTVNDIYGAFQPVNGIPASNVIGITSDMVEYTPAGTGAVVTTVEAQLQFIQTSTVDIKDAPFYAVGDNVTDDTNSFVLAEASAFDSIYLSEGIYYTTLTKSQLTKRYYGPGAIRFYAAPTQSDYLPGLNENQLVTRYPFLRNPNSSDYTVQRPIIFIGDSITAGVAAFPTGPSYPALIQEFIGSKLAYPTNTFLNGTNFEYQNIAGSGPVTQGTGGIVGISYLMQPGARLQFSSFFADYFGFWYTRAPGAGKIQKYRNAVLIETVDCAGAALDQAWSGYGTYSRPTTANTTQCDYFLDCIDGPVEIVGLFAIPQTPLKSMPIMVQARGGRLTADFTSDAVIDGIVTQVNNLHPGDGPYPLCVVALGTNDVYSAPATTPPQYKANLETICTKLIANGIFPVLQVPIRSTLSPVGGNFEDYRAAAYAVAQSFRLDICDLSDLDLETHGAMNVDRLHPNAAGHAIMAAKWIDFLGLNQIQNASFQSNLTLLNGAATTAGFAVPSLTVSRGGIVSLKGTVDITLHTPGTEIFSLNRLAIPLLTRAINCQTIAGNGVARLNINSVGAATLEYFSAGARPNFICLDGISFPIF